jgi:hypothetical protein
MAFKAELEAAPGFWNIQTFFYQNIGLNFSKKRCPNGGYNFGGSGPSLR